jgi:hypothetical protein
LPRKIARKRIAVRNRPVGHTTSVAKEHAMQNRYVGDIGDFVKLALLRALSPGHRLGVIWYLVPDESHNGDGRHVGYLRKNEWRHLDPQVFDGLARIVANGERSVAALERFGLLHRCQFVSDLLPLPKAYAERAIARAEWLDRAVGEIRDCNLVFLDPDNGLQPERFRPASAKAIKSASFADLGRFRRPGRTLVVYHHHTRRKGGHAAETRYNADRLRAHGFDRVDALRANRYSPRAFFFLNATDEIRRRAAAFAREWGDQRVTWCENPTEAFCASGEAQAP